MDELATSTGKKFKCDYFNVYPQGNQINLRIVGESLIRVVTVFSNREETMQLWCGTQYVSGYTTVIAIVPEGNAIRVVLGKE